jgi:hypothetical protein
MTVTGNPVSNLTTSHSSASQNGSLSEEDLLKKDFISPEDVLALTKVSVEHFFYHNSKSGSNPNIPRSRSNISALWKPISMASTSPDLGSETWTRTLSCSKLPSLQAKMYNKSTTPWTPMPEGKTKGSFYIIFVNNVTFCSDLFATISRLNS